MISIPFLSKKASIPFPPLGMRELVGPINTSDFDNPEGKLIYPYFKAKDYKKVFDFGCGCGRLARQLLMQEPVPNKYTGIDLHLGMINWCITNLSPCNKNFKFIHYDVYYKAFNPTGSSKLLPFPVEHNQYTLALAHSVFTHLIEKEVDFYLTEITNVLCDHGVFFASWFLFEKKYFPMMQEFQNSLYINLDDPTNAVIYDKNWLLDIYSKHGLSIEIIKPPGARGFQWVVVARKINRKHQTIFPQDDAPIGIVRASLLKKEPYKIGL
ncbi:MAG: class I SAM-dependent methyltransferase [Candidatus Shapirobacteria bacterium]